MADTASAAKPQKKHGRKAKPREQRKSLRSAAPTAIPAAQRSALPAGNGEPLPPAVAARMSDRFGADFGRVRVHDDGPAHEAARARGAKAFTVGDHIVFNDGRYRPDTHDGARLLAHELAHVVQQSRGGARPDPVQPNQGLEGGADAAAAQILAGQGAVQVAGASGVGVACEPEPKDATAKRRIVKAMGELQKLEATVAEGKKEGKPITGADSTRALDAITLARSESRASKNPTLISVADGLIDQFDAATRGTLAERPSTSFEQHPEASAMPMTPQEANRTVTAQRGFSAGLSAGKLQDARAEVALLESAEKAAGSQKERVEFRKKIDALKRRIAISTPTLKSAQELTQQKAVLDKQLAQATKPAEKQRLQVQIDSLKQQIDAVKAANANPDARPALSAMQGGRLGHSGATFVTIQIVGADGKLITTVQARNDPTRHAEVVILQQLEALPDKGSLKGATMIVSGDQEVCKKCTPEVAKFAKKYKFKEAYGDTAHAPQITSSAKLTGKDATAKTTVGKVADPAAVDKLEKAQQGAGQAGPEGTVQLKNKRFHIYSDPDQAAVPPSSASTKPNPPPQSSAATQGPPNAKPPAATAKQAAAAKKTSVPPAKVHKPAVVAAPKAKPTSTSASPPKPAATAKSPPIQKEAPTKAAPAALPKATVSAPKNILSKINNSHAMATAKSMAVGAAFDILDAWVEQKNIERSHNKDMKEKVEPAIESGIAALGDQYMAAQVKSTGKVYAVVTLETSMMTNENRLTIFNENYGGGVMVTNLYLGTDVVDVRIADKAEQGESSSEEGFERVAYKYTITKQKVTYSVELDRVPFDELLEYGAAKELPLDALRAEAQRQIADAEDIENRSVDLDQMAAQREAWKKRLNTLDAYQADISKRQTDRDAFAKVMQANQARKDKEAQDKLDREKLDRVLAADKEKASQKPPAGIPGLMPPGQSSASASPLKIGPFDASPEVTPGERGDLIASKYEQEKEKWVVAAEEIKNRYHAGKLTNEQFQEIRARRDRWVASLNRYAEAMGKVPEMKSGAGRMKALQDWLANDGHNAIMNF